MNTGVVILASIVPLLIFFAAMIMRIAADSLPESVNTPVRFKAQIVSYVLVAIGFFALLFTFFVSVGMGVVSLLIFALGISQLLDIELKIAGKRRQAQQAELLWMLATTVSSGGNLAADLESYGKGCTGLRRSRLIKLAGRIRRGTPLSEIVIPQGLLCRSAALEVQAGMRSGRLYESLRSAALRQTRELVDDSQPGRVQLAMMYPAVMIAVSLLIVGFLMYFIVPKFKRIFDDFGTELPQITKNLVAMSDNVFNFSLLAWPFVIFPIMMFALVCVAQFYGWRVVSQKILGYFFARAHTADLLRYMSQTVASGRPLQESLRGLAYMGVPQLMQRRVSGMISGIVQGESCWRQLRHQGFLRHNEVALLESAEKVGNLPWALNAIADGIERRWSYRMSALVEMFGPITVIMMGMVVGFIAIAMFMPLIKLLNDLS